VTATADGFIASHDIVTTLQAQSALLSLQLHQDQELDLSDGITFPWVLWVHHQPEIMQLIRDSHGVKDFGAIEFSFMSKGSLVKAQAFQMNLAQMNLQEGISLALIPVDGDLTIAPMTNKSHTFTSECQWLLDRLALQPQLTA